MVLSSQLLVEDVYTKHDLQLADFSPPQEVTPEPVVDKGTCKQEIAVPCYMLFTC